MPKENTTSKVKIDQILRDFKYAREQRRDWITAATQDLEFSLGKQWEDEDVAALEEVGVRALTVNKIFAHLLLLAGIQRQNKADFKVFPKGDEDQIKSDIATRLLKNVMDDAEGVYKISEQFEDATAIGEGWLEPYIDYTNDMVNGTFKLKKGNPFAIYPDPTSVEYDLSDASFLIKFSPDLTKNQLYDLFPKKRTQIDKIQNGKLDFDNMKMDAQGGVIPEVTSDTKDPYTLNKKTSGVDSIFLKQPTYDLTEYYYKYYVTKYYVANRQTGEIKLAKDKADAEDYIAQTLQAHKDTIIKQKMSEWMNSNTGVIAQGGIAALETQQPLIEQEVNSMAIEPFVEIIDRLEPEIRINVLIGANTTISDDVCWSFPKWKGFPFNRFSIYTTTIPVANKELMTQGIVRQLKSLNIELNKSRTQELRHLNETANSGWLEEEDSWVDEKKMEKFGASPGVHATYKKTVKKIPQRIIPTPLSSGHNRISADATQDIKEVSGMNTDLLALAEGGQASGRAIALRQKQGLLMVQKIFDNLSRSQKLLGRFILSVFGELYTLETALKVVGGSFITQNFQEPVITQDPATGQPIPQIDPLTGGIAFQVNAKTVNETFTEILEGTGIGKYDIFIGEGINSETTKMANSMMLTELVNEGIPIPPEIRIDESSLSFETKTKIKKVIEQMIEVQKAKTPTNKETGG